MSTFALNLAGRRRSSGGDREAWPLTLRRVRRRARARAGRTAPASRLPWRRRPAGGRKAKRTRGARKDWGLDLQASQRSAEVSTCALGLRAWVGGRQARPAKVKDFAGSVSAQLSRP